MLKVSPVRCASDYESVEKRSFDDENVKKHPTKNGLEINVLVPLKA